MFIFVYLTSIEALDFFNRKALKIKAMVKKSAPPKHGVKNGFGAPTEQPVVQVPTLSQPFNS